MKKTSIGIALLTACAMLLTACGGNGGNSNSTGGDQGGSAAASGDTNGHNTTADGAVTLRFGHADSESSVFHIGALKFKEEVEAASGGSILIDIYPSGQLGTIAEITSSVQMGTVDITAANSTVLSNFSGDFAVYDLPFLLDDYQHAYRTLDGSVGDYLEGKLAEQNLKVLGWWQIGFRNITANREINTIDDLSGLRIRTMTSTIYQEMLRELGIDPVPMDWSETFTALQQGTVDGQENPYTQILDANIFEVNGYAVETGHAYSPAALMISPQTWDKLDADQQEILANAAVAATNTARQESEDQIAAAKEKLLGEHGMVINTLDKAALKEKVQPVYDAHPELAELVELCDSYR